AWESRNSGGQRRICTRGAEFSTSFHLRTQRLILHTDGMSHKQETDQDIDDALNASFNGLATGQMDKREVKARLHAVQQKLDDVKPQPAQMRIDCPLGN